MSLLAAGNRAASFSGRRRSTAVIRGAALAVFAWSASAEAQSISVSGSPASMTINTAVAGQNLTDVSVAGTTYAVTTRKDKPAKVTAVLNSALPAGVTLMITLAAPVGAASQGAVALGTVAQDVVTNIPGGLKSSNFTITYQISATLDAGPVSLSSRIVTLRIVEI